MRVTGWWEWTMAVGLGLATFAFLVFLRVMLTRLHP